MAGTAADGAAPPPPLLEGPHSRFDPTVALNTAVEAWFPGYIRHHEARERAAAGVPEPPDPTAPEGLPALDGPLAAAETAGGRIGAAIVAALAAAGTGAPEDGGGGSGSGAHPRLAAAVMPLDTNGVPIPPPKGMMPGGAAAKGKAGTARKRRRRAPRV